MRLNFTPFVDLFSILAVGLLIIMSVTSGTDVVPQTDADAVVIQFYPGVPRDMVVEGETEMEMVRIAPYYVVGGSEVPPGSLPAAVGERVLDDSLEVWIVGSVDALNLEVGFRVMEVRDPRLLGRELSTRIEKVYRGEVREWPCPQTVGRWREPSVCVGSDCLRRCEG